MSEVPPQSALIVEVPQAEVAVGRHRIALDPNARRGVPAHVTVLFPFMPPTQIDASTLAELGRLFASTASFDFRLTHTAWFDHDVLWLAPLDPQPFRALTELVFRAFPDFPPFEGQFSDLAPHLTVANGCDLADMRDAERALQQHLPIHGHVGEVTLLVRTEGRSGWTKERTFPLA